MPTKLHRCYGAGYLHFVTTSCYRRSALLGTPQNRDLFLEVVEQVRRRYRFVVVGYVVMPEHVHLLFSEPERGDLSVVMKVLKQSFARGAGALITTEVAPFVAVFDEWVPQKRAQSVLLLASPWPPHLRPFPQLSTTRIPIPVTNNLY